MTKDEIDVLIENEIQIDPAEIKDKDLREYYAAGIKASLPDEIIKPDFTPAVDEHFDPKERIRRLNIPEVS